jgi:monoterpene epsilon-lactone hydrolase
MGEQAEMPDGLQVERSRLAGISLEYLTPALTESRVLLHCHGGAFAMGSCVSHRALVGRIAGACRARAVLPEYRLAPEHPFPAGLDDLLAVYEALLRSGIAAEQILVMGDSAGGNLAVSTMMKARDAGLPMPRAMVLISPWLDLTCTGESMRTRADIDPWLSPALVDGIRDLYLAGADPAGALASPLGGNLAGLPPMLVQVGDQEILLSDSQRLHERAAAAGIEVELEVYPELWHVWHLFAPALPDAVDAINRIAAFVDARFD